MLLKKLLILAAAGLILPACSTGPVDATFQYEIIDFEDVQVPWVGCTIDPTTGQLTNPSCQPSPPVIFRLDARVRNEDSEIPANNIRTWFTSTYSDIYLLPQEVLEAINIPSGGDWDTVTNRGEIWAEFSGRFDGNYRPTYHEGWTDKRGMASVWVFVNSMPTDESGGVIESAIQIGIASDSAFIRLQGG
ncbi:MAG: hypothetical protein KDA24_09910 [Deltaproteobacteria bacterium]|nr:hypothetical protein [Deltaproteobacteria bacterium]